MERHSKRACARKVLEMNGEKIVYATDLEFVEKSMSSLAKIRSKSLGTSSRDELRALTKNPALVYSLIFNFND